MVVEAGTQEALQGMLNELEPEDRKETEMITRALAALEPDGWRGVDHGLRDEVRCAQRLRLSNYRVELIAPGIAEKTLTGRIMRHSSCRSLSFAIRLVL